MRKYQLFVFTFLISVYSLHAQSVTITPTSACCLNNYHSISGSWIGTYTLFSTGSTEYYYSMNLKPDGKVIVDAIFNSNQTIAIGTWTLSGFTLTVNYSYVYNSGVFIPTTQIATVTWNPIGKLIGSYYNVVPNNGAGGTIKLDRIN